MNSTNHGWKSEPDGRGTASLLWSCIFTCFICTWSVIHLNVPADDSGRLRNFLPNLGYFVLGLMAPEAISLLAFDDYSRARAAQKRMNSTLRELNNVSRAKRMLS